MKSEEIKEFFQLFMDNIVSINGQGFIRSNKDSALNYQLYYGNYLITFRFIGALYLTNNLLRIKIVDMNTVKVLGEENIEVYSELKDALKSIVEFLRNNDIEVELKNNLNIL